MIVAAIVMGFLPAFALLIVHVRSEVEKALRTGVLPRWGKMAWLHQPISRDEDPDAFEDGLRWLRAIPWIAAVGTAFGILIIGLTV